MVITIDEEDNDDDDDDDDDGDDDDDDDGGGGDDDHGSHIHLHLHIESLPTWHFKNTQPFRNSGAEQRQGCTEHVFIRKYRDTRTRW